MQRCYKACRFFVKKEPGQICPECKLTSMQKQAARKGRTAADRYSVTILDTGDLVYGLEQIFRGLRIINK